MKQFFITIQTLLKSVNGILTVNKWKRQHDMIVEGKMELFQCPAAFIEFIEARPTNEMSMGGTGTQIYNIRFRIHILSWLLDSQDGDFEKNILIYDLQEQLYQALQMYNVGVNALTPFQSGSIQRVGYGEEYEWAHKGITHLVQEFICLYVDQTITEPVGGGETTIVPMPVEIDQYKKENQDAASPYDPLTQYFVGAIVIYATDGNTYLCIVDTPNPAGAFDPAKWQFLEPTKYYFTP